MAETLEVIVVEAEQELFAGRATKLFVPAVDGNLIILPGHTRMMASLVEGTVSIQVADGEEETIDITGGLVQATHEKITIIVGPTGPTPHTDETG